MSYDHIVSGILTVTVICPAPVNMLTAVQGTQSFLIFKNKPVSNAAIRIKGLSAGSFQQTSNESAYEKGRREFHAEYYIFRGDHTIFYESFRWRSRISLDVVRARIFSVRIKERTVPNVRFLMTSLTSVTLCGTRVL